MFSVAGPDCEPPPQTLLLDFLMRTGEVGEGGWETWRRAVETGGEEEVEVERANGRWESCGWWVG